MRLTLKLTAVLSLVIACGLAAQSYVHIQRVRALSLEEARDDLEILARVLASATSELWAVKGEAEARKYVARADERRARTRIRLVGNDHGPTGLGRTPSTPTVRGDVLVTFARITVATQPVARLEIARTRSAEREFTRGLIGTQVAVVAAVVGACGALALVIGFVLVGRPIERVIEHARRVASGDFVASEFPASNDEIGKLAREMNAMSERLAAADVRVRQERRQRTQAFEQLRHADRLATVGKIASGIAHELGTPLNVVSGRASLIASDATTTDVIRKNAETIVQQSEHMESIVRQLLDFSRRKGIQRTQSLARELVEHAVALVEPLAEEHNVSVDVSDVTDMTAKLDSDKALQVLTNLLVNAIHAMPSGGTIWVAAEMRSVAKPPDRHVAPGEFACLSIRDEGLGISADDIEQVFEPFFTTKDTGEGTGLGLSVSHGIVREHGGWIEVDSQPGKGSCFRVFLPMGGVQ